MQEIEAELDALTGGAFTRARTAPVSFVVAMAVVKEARQFPRFSVDLQVGVSVGAKQLSARTRDISRSGLCLIPQHAIPLDTAIQVELVLAFAAGGISEPLAITGRVVWCTALFRAFQIGVRFVGVEPERERHLEMFIGLLDGTLAKGPPLDDDEDTDRPSDPDDPSPPLGSHVQRKHQTAVPAPASPPLLPPRRHPGPGARRARAPAGGASPASARRGADVGGDPDRQRRPSPRRRAICPKGAPASTPTGR